ncbi:hypothetical protein D3C87_1120570 [compost metagenome]
MFELGHDLFHAHDGDVHVRHGRRQPAIALVFHQPQGARVGRREVHARQADIGINERLAQGAPPRLDQAVDVFRVGRVGNMLGEQAGDVGLRLVNGRHDDMRRLFAGQLHDVLAHVRFQARHAARFQIVIELDFLAGHRLALDEARRPVPFGDGVDDGVGLLAILGPVHLHAGRRQLVFQLHQQIGQARQRMPAHGFADVAQAFQLVAVGELRLALVL